MRAGQPWNVLPGLRRASLESEIDERQILQERPRIWNDDYASSAPGVRVDAFARLLL
jgi:hypothetical protein